MPGIDMSSRRVVEAMWSAAQAVHEVDEPGYADAERHGERVTRVGCVDHTVLFADGVDGALSRCMLRVMERREREVAAARGESIERFEQKRRAEAAAQAETEEEATISQLKARLRRHNACTSRLLDRNVLACSEVAAREEQLLRVARRQEERRNEHEAVQALEAARCSQLSKERRVLAAALAEVGGGQELDPIVFLDAPGLQHACGRILKARHAAVQQVREATAVREEAQRRGEEAAAEAELLHCRQRYKQLQGLKT